MYDGPSPLTSYGPCDVLGVERRLGIRRDTDGDGWDDDECDPNDPSVYPGAPINCVEKEGNPLVDRDCNGIPDTWELGCSEDLQWDTPLLVSTTDQPIHLTDAANGVLFDLNGDGLRERVSWTRPGADDAWLALDRDGDGLITSGKELFGSATAQPGVPSPNGFLALAQFDLPENGGNNDGRIDAQDAIWPSLRLWTDRNHDGVSQVEELVAARDILTAVSLDFRLRARRDQYGNIYRYSSKIWFNGPSLGWITDVYLVRLQ